MMTATINKSSKNFGVIETLVASQSHSEITEVI